MAKAKRTATKGTLPKGFKVLGGGAWSPAKVGDSITGKMFKSESVTQKNMQTGKPEQRTVYTIHSTDGEVLKVWESAGLKALQRVKKGAPVYIEFIGMGEKKKGRNPARLYLVATK